MILADTSVWVDHLARGDGTMTSLLDAAAVLMHPFVMGEIALGNLPRRAETLVDLDKLPKSVVADSAEVLFFIEHNQIFGTGIGYVDAHLLVATTRASDVRLWTQETADCGREPGDLGGGAGLTLTTSTSHPIETVLDLSHEFSRRKSCRSA